MNNSIFAKLRRLLANLYEDEQKIRRIVQDSEIDLARIALNHSVIDIWNAVLMEARKINRIDALIGAVKDEYGTNLEFQKVCEEYERAKSFDTYQQLSQADDGNSAEIEHLNAEKNAIHILEDKESKIKGDLKNPLDSDANEVRVWFFKELQPKEQSLLLTTALFDGMSRQKLIEVMAGIETILSTDD